MINQYLIRLLGILFWWQYSFSLILFRRYVVLCGLDCLLSINKGKVVRVQLTDAHATQTISARTPRLSLQNTEVGHIVIRMKVSVHQLPVVFPFVAILFRYQFEESFNLLQ